MYFYCIISICGLSVQLLLAKVCYLHISSLLIGFKNQVFFLFSLLSIYTKNKDNDKHNNRLLSSQDHI